MKALILAAGPGKGLSPFTATRPKAMINVGGRFLLENIIRLLREAGVNDLAVVVGHQRSKITEYFGRGAELGVNISYVYQEEPRGIADAILRAREFFYGGEYFLLVYSDHLTVENIYLQALESFGSFRAPVASICHTPEAMLYGNVYLDSQMRISRIVEKPRREDLGNYVLAGVFVLPARFFSLLEEAPMERGLERLIAQEGLYASIWEGS
ncbi:MAG: NDP-sugar synthase, partial [Nitrospinota bacterium]